MKIEVKKEDLSWALNALEDLHSLVSEHVQNEYKNDHYYNHGLFERKRQLFQSKIDRLKEDYGLE